MENNGTIRIEAEAFSSKVDRTINDANNGNLAYSWQSSAAIGGYSGSGLMQVLPNNGTSVTTNWTTSSPELRYTINFSNAGTYYVWLRGYAETADNLAVYVGLNGASPAPAQISLPRTGTWAWSNGTGDVAVVLTVPSAGQHTLHIWMADSGFALDRLVLTVNSQFLPEYSPGFWRNQSIYQIITDRFFDGVSTNNLNGTNAILEGNRTHGGDWRGIQQKLDYIKALGATAIWISPVLKNAKGDYDYHGYAATDFYNVDSRFGSLQDLQRLVAEAHRRGILVIADVVVNHGSTWVDSADAGWPNFRSNNVTGYNLKYNSGGQQYAHPFANSNLATAFGGNTNLANIFHNNGATQDWENSTQVELGELFSLDDFRTEAPYVRARMKEIWSYWINTVGFDAYRLDTVKHVEMGFWDEWSPAIRAAAQAADRPNFFQFGEVFDGSDGKCGSYTGIKSGGNYKVESVIDYPLYYTINNVFPVNGGGTGQIENRYNNLTTAYYDASAFDSLVLNIDNHDNPRFLSADKGGDLAGLELALVFLYTSRGIPSLYYGTEQDFNGGGDPNNREDMFDGAFEQGPSLGDNFNMTHPRFRLVAKLHNLRRLYPALRTGSHFNLWADWGGRGLLAYARRLGAEESYIVINTATSQQTIGARPTIHPSGTVLVDVLNPSNTLTVTTDTTNGIPTFTMPASSSRIYIAQSQVRALAPVVNAITPGHDATLINPASTITVTFSRGMNPAVTQAAFSTTPSSTGSFGWSSSNTVMTYTPSSNLTNSTLHGVRIESTATDTNGLAMFAPFESRFTTGVFSGTARPSINSVSFSGVTTSGATLAATVTPNGAATSVLFEYGTTSAYGTSTASQSIGSGNSPVLSTAPLSGLQPGTTYHFRVVASNTIGTTPGPDSTFTTDTPLPQVTTTAASYVTTSTASLNGNVDPNGKPTSFWFEYGANSDALTSVTPVQDAGSASGLTPRWASISGLTPDTTYYFRMVAQSGADIVRGSVLSFTTLPVKPTLVALDAQDVAATTATLSAAVNPNGTDSIVWFEYGLDTNYGVTTTGQNVPGASPTTVSVPLFSLTFGQTYHFRAVAQNSFGVTYGANRTFITGYPPPKAVTGGAAVTATTVNVAGLVNPNGPETVYWFEYGTNASYGLTTQAGASDNAEAYAVFSYTSGDAGAISTENRGEGFGPFTSYVRTSSSRGGIRLVTPSSANGTANRQIDGSQSFGIFAGTSTSRGTHSGYRPLTSARSSGQVRFTVRFDISNEKGFTGINLKSANGSSFGANELLSLGMTPAANGLGGNNAVMVTDAGGQRNVELAPEVRGLLIDVRIDFDTHAGIYTCVIQPRGASAATSFSGNLKLSGPTVNLTTLGYINGNNTGNNAQHMILDSLAVSSAAAAGSGTSDVPVEATLAGLSPDAVYHYRVAAMSEVGTSYGTNSTFATGSDLVLAKSVTGDFSRGGGGEFTLTVSNEGGASSVGTVTVTEQPPSGMTITSMTGEGWSFSPGSLSVTRSNALAPGGTYPSITVAVLVSSNAATTLTNTAAVAGGGDLNPANNSAQAVVTPKSVDSWRMEKFGSADNSGIGADTHAPAGDGIANLVKYALGISNVLTPATNGLPEMKMTNNKLALTFNRQKSATDIVYEVQATGDLFGFSNTPAIWSSASNAYGGGTNESEAVTVQDTVDASATNRRFMRLQISRP